jgi:hypothetical protein
MTVLYSSPIDARFPQAPEYLILAGDGSDGIIIVKNSEIKREEVSS